MSIASVCRRLAPSPFGEGWRWAILLFLLFPLRASAQKAETLYLSGRDAAHTVTWSFLCSKGMNSGKWRKIAVPSCWEQQGFGEYTYGRYYTKGDKASDETGRYRYDFKVPAAWREKTVQLVFEGVMTDATVTVNGQSAGAVHQGGFTMFRYDVSQLLRYGGNNRLEVLVEKQSRDKSVNAAERRADWWLFGGIYRPVYLQAMPKTHIAHVDIDAKADGNMRLRLDVAGMDTGAYRLQASIPGLDTKTMPLGNHNGQEVAMAWKGVKAWNTESPTLYPLTLRIVDCNGRTVHEQTTRVGFRTIEFRPRDGFYLNGVKLLIKGVNRHCFYPETGRATSRQQDIEDIRLIKAMNANAIRSHYPPGNQLLDICDSLGVLYFDELPGWQNRYNTVVGTKILKEMISESANHPCIFAWGNGNEGGFNLDLDPLFLQYDIQGRHVVHPWALFDGVDAHHYPAYKTGVARLHNGYNVFMPTEFLHSQFDKGGGASLDEYWEHWQKSPLFAGGFIWAWADEGVSRTDRSGEIDTDDTNAPDGLVGPHREREASWYTVRDVWSPIQIAPLAVRLAWDGRVAVSNHFLFSPLSSATMTYQVLAIASPMQQDNDGRTAGRKVVGQGTVTLPDRDVLPGETATCTVPLSDEARRHGDILQACATDAQGDTINVWSWPMRYADEYFAEHSSASSAGSRATVDGTTLTSANGIKAVFDETGMLRAVYNKEREIPFRDGPVLVGMKSKLASIVARQDGDDALLVMRYKGAVDSIVWRMTASGLLGMDAVILNHRKGHGFDGEFFDKDVRNFGFSFSYPEEAVRGMRWLGRGPYRVWRNRQRGTTYDVWQKDYNNTVTGQPDADGKLTYPEFKGYHANMYWAEMQSDEHPFRVYSETDGLYYRVFTPDEPRKTNNNQPTMQPFPPADISFLLEIPGIQSYKPIEQLGPQAQPSHIRINPGDEGLRVKLWFDFR